MAGAAYISGQKFVNEYDSAVHDYTNKCGVLHTEIMLPPHAPTAFQDRATLWNAVEEIEKAVDAQLARSFVIALPKELNFTENLKLVREYCRANFVEKGMCADFAIHAPSDENENIHVHIQLTTRKIKPCGKWDEKEKKIYSLDESGERIPLIDPLTGLQKLDCRNRKQWKRTKVLTNNWNNRDNVELWRKSWADLANKYLELNGVSERIDHRSYADQGVEKIPTVHVGRGRNLKKKLDNKRAGATNKQLHRNAFEIERLQSENRKLRELIDIENNAKMQASPGLKHWATIQNIKAIAETTEYVTRHGIDRSNVEQEYHNAKSNYNSNVAKSKAVESQIADLKHKIDMIDEYRKNRKCSDVTEQILYDTAKRELAKLFPSGELPRIADLRAELNSLYPEKDRLYRERAGLKAKFNEMTTVKLNLDRIARSGERGRGKGRGDVEL